MYTLHVYTICPFIATHIDVSRSYTPPLLTAQRLHAGGGRERERERERERG